MDKTKKTIKAYNLSALNYQNKFMDLKLYKKSFDYLTKFIKPNYKILDLGCGPGNVAKYLIEKEKSLNILGIDLSNKMISLAKQNVPGATFKQQDIRKLDFKQNEYDILVAAFCLPFLYDEETINFIKKISVFVKKNGIIYLSTMKGEGHRFEKTSFSDKHEIFFNYYEKNFLIDIFKKNNLKIDKYIEQDYLNNDGNILKDMIFILKKS